MNNTDLYVTIAFTVFAVMAYFGLRRQIVAFLQEYSSKVAQAILEARTMKEDAEKEMSKMQQKYQKIREEVNQIIDLAKTEADFIKEDAKQKVQNLVAQKNALAVNRLHYQEEEVYRQIKNEILVEVIKIAEKQLVAKMNADAKSKSVDESMQRLKNVLH